MFLALVGLGLLPLLCSQVSLAEEPTVEESLDALKASLGGLHNVVTDLSRHVMQQSFQERERIRSEGSSGIVKVRGYTIGSNSYHFASHVGESFNNMHDHANYEKKYGLGDFYVVLNGVFFRTRHNDFELRRASTTSSDWLATEPIESPPLPESFEGMSVEEQIQEVREYIRAFKYQDTSIRPYQEFFKPVMCYLEGWWTANVTDIEDGFKASKTCFTARSWQDLHNKARADAFLGSDYNVKQDGASLPVTILGIDETTGLPIYGQWNYRILCHPLKDDLPTAFLKPVEDLAYRKRKEINTGSMSNFKGSRYNLDDNPEDTPEYSNIMDTLVGQIPGMDNVPGSLSETDFGRAESGNLHFYNRAFATNKDAMNSRTSLRGFSDGNMFVAMNTQERVAPLVVRQCTGSTNCPEYRVRASWMFPLEIIYMTPLQRWNPYDVPHSTEDWDTYAPDGKDGKSEAKAALGTHDRNFYRIPSKVFDAFKPSDRGAADAYSGGKYIKNSNGDVYHMTASGPRTVLPAIDGVGEIRLRYPIAPLHEEGTAVWKELDGFVDYLSEQFANLTSSVILD